MKKCLTLLLSLAFAACNLAPKYETPQMALPREDGGDYSVFTNQKWWEMFEDGALNKLEDSALAYNRDLAMAIARVDQARAAASAAGADRLPTAGYGLGGEDVNGAKDFSAGLSVSYEADLWGKYKNASGAAKARLLATEAQKDTVRLALTADTAKTYFAVRTLEAQTAITAQTLADREESVRIYNARYKNGLIGESDVKRIEAERDTAKAALAELKKNLAQNQSALLVLTGANPADIAQPEIEKGKELAQITLVPQVPQNVPSSILINRPDIRAAEYQLIEANANIGAARAAYFPAVSLTAAGGSESASLADLFNGGLWSFAANITGPLFNGGKIKAGVEQTTARQREMTANYEKAVQTAFKEAFDALTANRLNREARAAYGSKTQALKRSLDLVQKQYDAGLISLLDLLDVQRGYLQAQTDEAAAIQAELNAVVAVSKALGGGLNAK